MQLDKFTLAYIECALWSSTDDDGEPLDDQYGIDDIAPECLAQSVEDCKAFQEEHAGLLASLDDEQCGHDFWLTRNGHGAGFWDGDWPEIGDRLTKAVGWRTSFPEVDLCTSVVKSSVKAWLMAAMRTLPRRRTGIDVDSDHWFAEKNGFF